MRQLASPQFRSSRDDTGFEKLHELLYLLLLLLLNDEQNPLLSVLKVRGEISHQLANGGEFATSRRNRWIGSVSDGRETSRSVTVAGDLSGALPSQNRRVTGISIVGRISPGITSSHSIDEGRAAAPDW